jgi:hypothetical protein
VKFFLFLGGRCEAFLISTDWGFDPNGIASVPGRRPGGSEKCGPIKSFIGRIFLIASGNSPENGQAGLLSIGFSGNGCF